MTYAEFVDHLASKVAIPEFVQGNRGNRIETQPLIHAALGLSSESGEFASSVKAAVYYGRPLDEVNAKEEIGDIIWFAQLACNALGLTLEQVIEANRAKLNTRYKEGFSAEAANNRHTEAELAALVETLRKA